MQDKSYQYVAAYGIAIVIFALIAKTKAGYSILYYSLVLGLLFLLFSQGKVIVSYLNPILTGNTTIPIITPTTGSGTPTV